VLVAVPAEVVIAIFPVVAPAGTVALIEVAETTVYTVAVVVLNFTAVAPVKFVPVMVTLVPIGPEVGVKDEIVGTPATVVTVKLALLVAVPPGVVIVIFPVVAPLGTVAVIDVALTTVYAVAVVVLNLTVVAPVRFVPVIVTRVPTGPEAGSNVVIVGAGVTTVTVNDVLLVAVPPGVVTVIFPVVAPLGTVAVIDVALTTVNDVATVVLNLTAVAPVKFVPVIVTRVPMGPVVGVKELIVGRDAVTVKLPVLVAVPPGVVTVIFPVVAPVGTVTVIDVADTTLNAVAAVVLNFTAVAPVKFVPVIVTSVPTGAVMGVNEVITGADAVTVKFAALVAVPPAVVTLTFPVVAAVGTVAVIDVAETTVNDVAAVVLNLTTVALVKLVPVMVTSVPMGPDTGVKDVMVGADALTVGSYAPMLGGFGRVAPFRSVVMPVIAMPAPLHGEVDGI